MLAMVEGLIVVLIPRPWSICMEIKDVLILFLSLKWLKYKKNEQVNKEVKKRNNVVSVSNQNLSIL